MTLLHPIAPIEPDVPFDEDAFDAIMAAATRLINAGALHEAAYEEALHPRDRMGKWMRSLGLKHYEVGGAVRDSLMGRDSKDVDYIAMATPEEIKNRVEAAGGVAMPLTVRDRLVGIRAFHPDLPAEGVEIAPPRIEQSTGSGRHDFTIVPHPGLDTERGAKLKRESTRVERNLRAAQDRANWGAGAYSESHAQAAARDRRSQATIRKHKQTLVRLDRQLDALPSSEQMLADDAQRRDFTVNSLLRDPETGEVIDPTGYGKADVAAGVLRTTHETSFRDDPLRILRGARFVSTHGYDVSPETRAQMIEHAQSVTALTQKGVSGTVQNELNKLLMGKDPAKALKLLAQTGVLGHLIPELAPTIGFDQNNPYHDRLLDDHLFDTVQNVADAGGSLEARYAALFHDAGKPETASLKPDGSGQFRFHSHPEHGNHQDVGAEKARAFLNRANYPDAIKRDVTTIVAEHMLPQTEKPTPVKARRLRAKFGDKILDDLLAHKLADQEGHARSDQIERIHELRRLIDAEREAGTARSLKDLAINGNDLKAIVEPGPQLGAILKQLLAEVVDQPQLNTREWLLGRAAKLAGGELQEAFDPAQPRWPKGTPHAGKWRPKLAVPDMESGAFEKAIGDIKTELEAMHSPGNQGGDWFGRSQPEQLAALGTKIHELALKHSTAGEYSARRQDLDDRLFSLRHERRMLISRERQPTNAAEAAARRQRLDETFTQVLDMETEVAKLRQDEQRALQDAIVGVLSKIRPMGGKLYVDELGSQGITRRAGVNAPPHMLEMGDTFSFKDKPDTVYEVNGHEGTMSPGGSVKNITKLFYRQADRQGPGGEIDLQSPEVPGEVIFRSDYRAEHEKALREVQRLLPRAWIEDMNNSGRVAFDVRGEVRGYHTWIPKTRDFELREEDFSHDPEAYKVARENFFAEHGYGRTYTSINPMTNGEVLTHSKEVGGDSKIVLPRGEARTYLHELLHRVQFAANSDTGGLPGSVRHRAEYNYLTMRTGVGGTAEQFAEKTVKLAEITPPGSGYEDYEVTLPDEFIMPYFGKVYGGTYSGPANELLTMAIEYAYYSNESASRSLLRGDPQTFYWSLGLMAAN